MKTQLTHLFHVFAEHRPVDPKSQPDLFDLMIEVSDAELNSDAFYDLILDKVTSNLEDLDRSRVIIRSLSKIRSTESYLASSKPASEGKAIFSPPFRLGDVVSYRSKDRSWTRGEHHIIHNVVLHGTSVRYSTNRGAWFDRSDFDLVRESDAASIKLLIESTKADDEDWRDL